MHLRRFGTRDVRAKGFRRRSRPCSNNTRNACVRAPEAMCEHPDHASDPCSNTWNIKCICIYLFKIHTKIYKCRNKTYNLYFVIFTPFIHTFYIFTPFIHWFKYIHTFYIFYLIITKNHLCVSLLYTYIAVCLFVSKTPTLACSTCGASARQICKERQAFEDPDHVRTTHSEHDVGTPGTC